MCTGGIGEFSSKITRIKYHSKKEGECTNAFHRHYLSRRPFTSPVCRNVPQRRAILANCSNLMIWSDIDVFEHFTSTLSASGAPVNELALRCAREVYREYQRQLWHPDCLIERMEKATRSGRDSRREGLSVREQTWVDELLPGDEVEIVRIGSVESIKGPGKSAEHHSHTFLQG